MNNVESKPCLKEVRHAGPIMCEWTSIKYMLWIVVFEMLQKGQNYSYEGIMIDIGIILYSVSLCCTFNIIETSCPEETMVICSTDILEGVYLLDI